MTSSRARRPDSATVRHALVVTVVGVAALILGIVVAGQPQDVPSDVVSSRLRRARRRPRRPCRPETTASSRATTASTTTATSTMPSTSTTTTAPAPPALVPESSVRVVVADATNVSGLAARTAEQLRGFGYVDVVAADAVVDRPDSTIVYVDGRSGEALRLAVQLGLDPGGVQPRQLGPLTVERRTGRSGSSWEAIGL